MLLRPVLVRGRGAWWPVVHLPGVLQNGVSLIAWTEDEKKLGVGGGIPNFGDPAWFWTGGTGFVEATVESFNDTSITLKTNQRSATVAR